MALILPFKLFAVFDIYDNNMLRTNLLEAEAMGLHENLVLARNAHGHMAKDVVPVAFVGEDVAGIS
jgi:hypothetical protein